jgi:hypothetical protein
MTFKTQAGTELPLLDLRGKPYLQVAHRLVWFREEKPDWPIKTEFIQLTDTYSICKAEVYDTAGIMRAMAHKREDKADFKDFMEKSETSAIGRALAMLGYGTQFAPDLDEGERLADSPVDAAKKKVENFLGPSLDTVKEIFPGTHVVPLCAKCGKEKKLSKAGNYYCSCDYK